MKHYLVAIDFSDSARNALNYAVELAKATNATITLFHSYVVPVTVSDLPSIPVISYDELEKDKLELLNNLKSEVKRLAPDLRVDVMVRIGSAKEQIDKATTAYPYDLIVMGIKGHGKMTEFFGSTTIAVSGNSEIPVLIIPFETRFKAIFDITFAFDYREIGEPRHMDILREFAQFFKARIHVLNIGDKETREIPVEKALVAVQIDHILEEVGHDLSFPNHENIIPGIEKYLAENKSELLVMIRRNHGFFEKLIKGSYTRKMAFHTHIPLLVLHD
jgi:nucleotide-binding universal stress UspA family protein